MKKIKRLSFAFFALFFFNVYSQISGNKVYGYNNYQSSDASKTLQSSQSTDSTLIISARGLLYKVADF